MAFPMSIVAENLEGRAFNNVLNRSVTNRVTRRFEKNLPIKKNSPKKLPSQNSQNICNKASLKAQNIYIKPLLKL
jgi:hypothetical protein